LLKLGQAGCGISGFAKLDGCVRGESRCWKGVDVKGVMLNTIGDHTKEMSIELCQIKPAFYAESKTHTHTHKIGGMRDRGS